MGEVIAFSARAACPRRAAPDAGETGRILFFLGVRYERMGDADLAGRAPPADKEPGPAKKRKRRARWTR